MDITVKKLTNIGLLHAANEATTGHASEMTLEQAYKAGHSNIRTQLFWIVCREIPLCVASQLTRHHVGVQFFQRSRRPDRGGESFGDVVADIARRVEALGEMREERGRCKNAAIAANQVHSLYYRFDRKAPTDLAMLINAEALINMAHKRMCARASLETRKVVRAIAEGVKDADPALYKHLEPICLHRGGRCSEPHGCGPIPDVSPWTSVDDLPW